MDKTIYLDDLNEMFMFRTCSWKNSPFQNAKNYFYIFKEFTELPENTIKNAVKLALYTLHPEKDYILVKFKNYFGFVLLKEHEKHEVENKIYCFDSERIYPMQGIRKTLDWDYGYNE